MFIILIFTEPQSYLYQSNILSWNPLFFLDGRVWCKEKKEYKALHIR